MSYSLEILSLLELISSEHKIHKDKLFAILEETLTFTAKKKFNCDVDVVAEINKKTGKYTLARRWQVVSDDQLENPEVQISATKCPNLPLGQYYLETLENIFNDRISINTFKKNFFSLIGKETNKAIVDKIISNPYTILTGRVKFVLATGLELDILKYDTVAFLPKKQLLPTDDYKVNDICHGVVMHAEVDSNGHCSIILSRTSINMVRALLHREVPEIEENIVDIKKIARVPGNRTKIAVNPSVSSNIDPVGACIGFKGSRIQSVSKELNGEKIDVFLWDDNIAQSVANSFSGLPIYYLVLDVIKKHIFIFVPQNRVAQFVGVGGINCNLTTDLLEHKITVIAVPSIHSFINDFFSTEQQRKLELKHIDFSDQFNILSNEFMVHIKKIIDVLHLNDQQQKELQFLVDLYRLAAYVKIASIIVT
jgi:N utilization substance protein A